ncbi:MAG TPA: GNAT family N-acetyltransferase [Ktedonobacterales bacterium]|nr:GNAT family N-acetyltransferase [Ktedonobacterales bacterium]
MSDNAARLAAIFGEVHTERLVLRRLRPDDGPALFAIDGDPATNQHNPAGPARDPAECEERLREWLREWDQHGFGYWAVALPETDAVIGFGGVRLIRWREREALNLYYRFTPSAWGHGYATETARMAVALARAHLPQWPVVARTRPANSAAIRTAERAGLARRPDLDTEHVVLVLGWDS